MLAHIILCGACASLDDQPGRALRSLDHAFIFGGLTDVYRDCAELLDQPVADATEGASDSPVTATSMPPPPPIGTTMIPPVERHACRGGGGVPPEAPRRAAPPRRRWRAGSRCASGRYVVAQTAVWRAAGTGGDRPLDGRKQSAQGESAGAAGWGERIEPLCLYRRVPQRRGRHHARTHLGRCDRVPSD